MKSFTKKIIYSALGVVLLNLPSQAKAFDTTFKSTFDNTFSGVYSYKPSTSFEMYQPDMLGITRGRVGDSSFEIYQPDMLGITRGKIGESSFEMVNQICWVLLEDIIVIL